MLIHRQGAGSRLVWGVWRPSHTRKTRLARALLDKAEAEVEEVRSLWIRTQNPEPQPLDPKPKVSLALPAV